MLGEVLLGSAVLMYVWSVGLSVGIDVKVLGHGQRCLREAIVDGRVEELGIKEAGDIISAGNSIRASI